MSAIIIACPKKILVEKMDGFGGLSKMTLEIYDEKEELGRWN